jgi:hypothetical protein
MGESMKDRIAAIPGQWYLDRGSEDMFQVVSVDQDDGSIELQHTDGSLEETSVDDWVARSLEGCEQPEDWIGSFDDLEADDIGLPEAHAEPHAAEIPMERALLEIEEQRTAAPVDDIEE